MLCTRGRRSGEHGVRVVSERGAVGREEQLGGERDLELLYRDAAPQLWRAIYGFAGADGTWLRTR